MAKTRKPSKPAQPRHNEPSPDTPLSTGQRPGGVSAMMLVPLGFGVALLLAVAVLALQFGAGGVASGERKTATFAMQCEDGADPQKVAKHVQGRAEDVGMGEIAVHVEGKELRLTAIFPGLPDEDTTLPEVLSTPGRFWLEGDNGVVISEADVEDASVTIDEGGDPYTRLLLLPPGQARLQDALDADPSGSLRMRIDEVQLDDRPNSIKIDGDSLRMPTGQAKPRVRMRLAADRAIALSHGPLACELSSTGVALASGEE